LTYFCKNITYPDFSFQFIRSFPLLVDLNSESTSGLCAWIPLGTHMLTTEKAPDRKMCDGPYYSALYAVDVSMRTSCMLL